MTTDLPLFVRGLINSCPKVGGGVNNWLFRCARILHPHRSPSDIEAILEAASADCGGDVSADDIARAVKNSHQYAWQAASTASCPLAAWTSEWPRFSRMPAASARLITLEQIAIHTRLEPGQFSRCLGTAGASGPVVQSCRYWIDRASLFGEACGNWARQIFEQRGPQALRAIIALCQLSAKHNAGAIDRVCARACAEGLWRYKDLRRMLEQGAGAIQQPLPFADEHPLIRDLQSYAQFMAEHSAAFTASTPN